MLKYEIGQSLFTIENNKIKEIRITDRIYTERQDKNYPSKIEITKVYSAGNMTINEDKIGESIFTTKEELIKYIDK